MTALQEPSATRESALKQLDSDLWVATRPLPIAVGDVGARMTVIRTRGDVLLHSPVTLDAATKQAVDALGVVRWIVAPNKAHHLFVAPWAIAYPNAATCAPPGLAEKRRDLRFAMTLDDGPKPTDWPDELDYLLVGGAPLLNELAFLHRPSRTLVLTDLVFNVRAGESNRARFFHWIVGATGRFGPHRLIRSSFRKRSAVGAAIERVLTWDFDRIVMSHGHVLETGGRAALERAFSFLRGG